LKEFEVILTEFKQQGADDQDFEKKVEAKKNVASRRVAKRSEFLRNEGGLYSPSAPDARKAAPKRGKAAKRVSSSEDEVDGGGRMDVDDSEQESPRAPPPAKKRAPARRGRKISPASDEEEEEEEQPKPAKRAAPRRSASLSF
jgi:hypothetical protein